MADVIEHPFSDMGPAPYRFVGAWAMPSKALLEANPSAYNMAIAAAPKLTSGIGSCACCGIGITDHFTIKCGDGTRHAVGCDCVEKVTREPKLISEMKLAKREIAREKRHARESRQLDELRAALADTQVRAILAALPHPRGFSNRKTGEPLSFLDQCEWTHQNAGMAGCGRLLRHLKKLEALKGVLP